MILIAPPGAAYRDDALVSEERRDPLNRQEKQEIIQELREKFERATGFVLTDYKGMTVAELTEFRDGLRGNAVEYRVVKNTLARIAVGETAAASLGESFKGPVGVAIGYDDPVTVAKSVLDYAKKNQKLTVTAGFVDGAICDVQQLKQIAELPPREVLLSVLAGTLQAPAAQLARLLNATVARLGYALHALKDQKAAG